MSTRPCNKAEKIKISDHSMTDVPSDILIEIFLKLPTQSIMMCKSVCNAWRRIISDPYFVGIHFARAKECRLVREVHKRSCYVFEDDEHASEFCRCRASNEKCKQCRSDEVMNKKFMVKIPMRDSRGDVSDSECINYRVMNSCNGLLCLYNHDDSSFFKFGDKPIVVCNPVTGEVTYLPMNYNSFKNSGKWCGIYGFGFSPKHNEYKVIRVVEYGAEIHTLGTESWRKLDSRPVDIPWLKFPVYLDGALHWLHKEFNEDYKIVSFDLNEERCQVHCIPLTYRDGWDSLRAQGGLLYVSNTSFGSRVQIWEMNEKGNLKSWTKLCSIDGFSKLHPNYSLLPYHPPSIRLVCCLRNDAVVMLDSRQGGFIYYDELEGLRFKPLKFLRRILRSRFEVVDYTPSFISLYDILMPGNFEVLKINSG